jgi:hypothetical protein
LPCWSPKQLNFDMPWIDQRLFKDQFVAAKTVQCFGARRANLLRQFLGAVHQAHAAPATAGAGLDHQRIADAFGFAAQGRVILFGALIAFDARHPASIMAIFDRRLLPISSMASGWDR